MAPRTTNFPQVCGWAANHHDTYPFISPGKADMAGKSVLITGASRGIGKTTAVRFAAAGCSKIAVAARSALAGVEEEVKAAAAGAGRPEPQVLILEVDVTSEESVKAAASSVDGAFGGSLDVVVTNAGYLEEWRPMAEADPVEWWKTWEINIRGTFLCARFFIPLLLKSTLKLLIMTSSIGAHNIKPGASGYQTTKFAVCRLAEFADQEYHSEGLLALALHPGGVQTALGLNMPADMHRVLIDPPELAADTTVWLARERRDWLAGRFISVNWDMEELEGRKDEIVQKDLFKFRLTL